jgi:hypothetical protein
MERFRRRVLQNPLINPRVKAIAVVGSSKRNGGKMAILFSTWVKIGKVAEPHLKKNLEELLANSTSALRIECLKENGVEVFYIRDRNIFDYLWEKLDAYESQLREMRTRTRVALESEIRPFIQEEFLQGGESLPLWRKIEQRILEDNFLIGKQPYFQNISDCLIGSQETVDQLASIPDGLSLSSQPHSAFIAGVVFGFDEGQGLKPNKPMHVGYSKAAMIEWPYAARLQSPEARQIKQFYLSALHALDRKNLQIFSSIVITPTSHPFEKDGALSDEHAKGFLMAAKAFIKEKKDSKKPVSLLIATENKAWYKKLQKEMLGIGSSLPISNNNAVQYKQSDIPVPESPASLTKVSKVWNEKYGNSKKVKKNLDYASSSDEEILI